MKEKVSVGAVLLLIGSLAACAGGGSSPSTTPTTRPLPSARPGGATPTTGGVQGQVKVISEDAPPPEGADAAAQGTAQPAPQVQVEERAQPAVDVAQQWIGVVDQGGYSASWSATGQPVRGAVTQEQWVSSLTSVRQPLGAVSSRLLTAAQYTTSLPGAPEGQYVVIQYDTDFASAPDMVETVTAMMESDGQWRVVGYQIKSAAEMQQQMQQQQGQQPPAQGQQQPPAEQEPPADQPPPTDQRPPR